jgi:predicted transposase/invertase (TIGR01784 family)
MNDAKPNRQYKDSLFVTFLTEDPARLIEVYNAVFDADVPPDAEVEINTLENVLYHTVNNDLSFTLGNSLVVLMEDQATLNMNMPLRLLMYLARVYEKLLPSKAVYAVKTIKVPKPEFVVFYNGKEEMPDTLELKLSEAFKDAHTKETLELTVTMYNINPGHNEQIRSRSKALRDYSTFIAKIHEYEKSGTPLAEAIGSGVKYCIENGVMPEFIKKHSSEVMNMLFVEYDPVEARQVAIEEGYEDGREDGRKEGRKEGAADARREYARRMKADGVDVALIGKYTSLSADEIGKL